MAFLWKKFDSNNSKIDAIIKESNKEKKILINNLKIYEIFDFSSLEHAAQFFYI